MLRSLYFLQPQISHQICINKKFRQQGEMIGFVFYLKALQLEQGIDCHKARLFSVVTVRIGDFANPAFDFSDLQNSSTFHPIACTNQQITHK